MGAAIAIQHGQPEAWNDFLEEFLEQGMKAQRLALRGGGKHNRLTGAIVLGNLADPIEARLQPNRRRLDARADMAPYVIRPLVDVWHGPFDDLETIDERLPLGGYEFLALPGYVTVSRGVLVVTFQRPAHRGRRLASRSWPDHCDTDGCVRQHRAGSQR